MIQKKPRLLSQTGPDQRMLCPHQADCLVTGALGGEAITAVDGTVTTGHEGHLGGVAALGTGHVVHLTGSGSSVAAVLSATGSTAGSAAGGLVLEALLDEEGLLGSGEHEFVATVTANKGFVLVHGDTS